MSESADGRRPPGAEDLPRLNVLLAMAERRSDRCLICKWIIENRGSPAETLGALNIGGVDISPEAQQRHLLSHPTTGIERERVETAERDGRRS